MPEEEMTIEKLAGHAKRFFKTKTRGEGRGQEEIYILRNRYPTWIYDMVYSIHDDGKWLPDDYKYEYIVDALGLLEDGADPDEPELEADVYTSDLMKWFASHRERMGIVDEAVSEFGWDKERGIEGAISLGQWREKEEVFRRVVDALRERLSDIEAGEPEIFKTKAGGTEGVLDWSPDP